MIETSVRKGGGILEEQKEALDRRVGEPAGVIVGGTARGYYSHRFTSNHHVPAYRYYIYYTG